MSVSLDDLDKLTIVLMNGSYNSSLYTLQVNDKIQGLDNERMVIINIIAALPLPLKCKDHIKLSNLVIVLSPIDFTSFAILTTTIKLNIVHHVRHVTLYRPHIQES